VKIDFNDYKVQEEVIKKIVDKKGLDDLDELVSEIASMSGCPILCVLYFIGSYKGFNEEILNSMRKISKFYKYTDIRNCHNISIEDII